MNPLRLSYKERFVKKHLGTTSTTYLSQGTGYSHLLSRLRPQKRVGMFPCLFGFSVAPSPSRSGSLDRLNKALSSHVGVPEVSDTKVCTDTAGCLPTPSDRHGHQRQIVMLHQLSSDGDAGKCANTNTESVKIHSDILLLRVLKIF